jgi:hypothetical protein
VLGTADPASEGWTFASTGDRRVWWWCRRLAAEVAVHRWDAEFAQRGSFPRGIEPDVAGAGVEEFMIEFLPGLRTSADFSGCGSLHLHGTDGYRANERVEWWVDLGRPGLAARVVHREGDTLVMGARSDLLLWLNNRGPLESIQVVSHDETVERSSQLRF